jgi:molecular chaperone DnaK
MILVGGPTRLPTIRHYVSEYFQREPEAEVNPDEVVAIGAGIHAHALTSTGDDADETLLFDVTPLTLRLGIAGDLTEPIIERNSPLPIDATRMFHPVKDGQESVAVKIYQGESRSTLGNETLGMFEFSGYEPGPRDSVHIEVSFEISTEGIVRVSARDPRTGVAHSTTVSMSSGLSSSELDDIVSRDRTADLVPANAPPPIELESGDPLELVEEEAPLEVGEPGPAGGVSKPEKSSPPIEPVDDDQAIDLDSAMQDADEDSETESLFDSSVVMLSEDDPDSEPG